MLLLIIANSCIVHWLNLVNIHQMAWPAHPIK